MATNNPSPDLSIVTGTLDRLPHLMALIPSIRAATFHAPNSALHVSYEIIIVDGGSVDGTSEYLLEQPDVSIIWQGERRGAVAAFNAGFEAATGRYVANLNDDALCMGACLYEACRALDNRQGVGQIALPFSDPRHPPSVHKVTVGTPPREYLYGNFAVTRRALGQSLGWWGTHSYHYGGDTELSLQVWRAGYSVMALSSHLGYVRHYRADDATRVENKEQGRSLGQRWRSWNGKPSAGGEEINER